MLGKKDTQRVKSLDVEFDKHNLLKYPWFNYSLVTYQAYQKGILPYPGSLSEQPAKIMEIMSTLQQLELEAQEAARKKIEKEQRGRR